MVHSKTNKIKQKQQNKDPLCYFISPAVGSPEVSSAFPSCCRLHPRAPATAHSRPRPAAWLTMASVWMEGRTPWDLDPLPPLLPPSLPNAPSFKHHGQWLHCLTPHSDNASFHLGHFLIYSPFQNSLTLMRPPPKVAWFSLTTGACPHFQIHPVQIVTPLWRFNTNIINLALRETSEPIWWRAGLSNLVLGWERPSPSVWPGAPQVTKMSKHVAGCFPAAGPSGRRASTQRLMANEPHGRPQILGFI